RGAVDNPVVRAVDRHESAHNVVGAVLTHTLARERDPETVGDDIDLLRARVGEHRLDEPPEIRDIGQRRVRLPRPVRRVLDQVALVALVAEAPQLARRIPLIREKLRERVHAAERVARSRKRGVVVAMEEDDRGALDRAAGPEPDDRYTEGLVDDDRKVGRERGADRAPPAPAPVARAKTTASQAASVTSITGPRAGRTLCLALRKRLIPTLILVPLSECRAVMASFTISGAVRSKTAWGTTSKAPLRAAVAVLNAPSISQRSW